MPEIRYYIVEQIREVKISANNPMDAAILATRVFNNEKHPEDQINVHEWPREIELNVKEDR